MAHEIKDWKAPGCSLILKTNKLSNREIFSVDAQEEYGVSEALNADYQKVEAVAIVANFLGAKGLEYGKDFIFKTAGLNEIIFDFVDKDTLWRADWFLSNYLSKKGDFSERS